jgi:hypothetical protein
MKYSVRTCKYATKSPYTYVLVEANEPLTKFHVWGKTKGFNTLFYDEKKVLDLMQEMYPNAERIEKKYKPRTKKILT